MKFLKILKTCRHTNFTQRYLNTTATNHSFIKKRSPCKQEVTKKDECVPAPYQEQCMIEPCAMDPNNPEPRIVIIGAGIAGLSAAHRLVQCGITNFTILEATDRPGGRIHSCWMGDSVAEIGAQYIEGGCVTNPIFTLAEQEGLLKSPLHRPDDTKSLFVTSEGRAIDLPISITASYTFRQIEQQAATLFSHGCERTHGTLMNFVDARIQQELHNFPEDQRYDAARVMYGMTNSTKCQCGEDLSRISADNFGSLIKIPGGSIGVPLGFVGVLAPLLRDLPECAIKYCRTVENIRWGSICPAGGPRAIVRCCDGEEYQADYVIITVSLGVLKAVVNRLFCPTLPAEKTEAISNLGYGYVNKIFLEYCRQFWVWREGGIKLAWSADELADKSDWVKGLYSIDELAGSRHVLGACVGGQEACNMEKCSDEEIAESITRLLRQITGDPSLPYPSNILRSKWCSDPYFYGSYSYLGVNSTVGHQRELGAPIPGPCENIPPILLFAGEATCPGHYSTVHGARLSGIREAERILQMTKLYKGPPPKLQH